MADPIDMELEREKRMAHATMHVRCVDCGHEWQATAPIPWPSKLECSHCSTPESADEDWRRREQD
jgi:hypothetical protein